jgi:hypothetical protein
MSFYEDKTQTPSLKLIAFILSVVACVGFGAAFAYNSTLSHAPAETQQAPVDGTGV